MITFDFGSALQRLREGKRVARQGWNGKNMYLCLVEQWVDPTSGGMQLPYIVIFTAQQEYVPWTASQTDLLSNDWMLVTDAETSDNG